MLTPVYIAVGFAVGFAAGVQYGSTRPEPWQELADKATRFAVWAHRVANQGPRAPATDIDCPPQDVTDE